MKKVINAAAAILCALGVGGGILSCSGGTNYVGTSGSSTTTTTTTTTTSGTVYAWNFSTTDLVTVPAYDKTGTTEISKGTLQAAATYESTPAGLTMSLANGSYFNKVSPAGTVSSSYTTISADASAGYIEPDGSVSTELTVSVKGPFTATMLCGANSSSDKTDRYAYIKVNGAEAAAPNKNSTTLSATGEKLTYSYTGTDTVTVAFGSTKIVRIFDIKIETENGNGTGKTAGQVLSSASFASQTSTVTNSELGLTGINATSSSDEAVATTVINGDNVVITSVSAGTATITVTDASSHQATIAVTVNATGAITTNVTPYSAPSAGGATTYTLEASNFDTITTKTTAITNPTSSDATTAAAITALSLQLGVGMRIDGSSLRFNCGGALQKAGKNGVIFTAPTGATSVEVHFYNNGASAGGRHLQIAEYSDSTISPTTSAEVTVDGSSDDIVTTFSITAGTKYSLGCDNGGVYITKIVIQ